MANIKSIHSVCNSIVQYLQNAYEAYPLPEGAPNTTMQDEYPCNFRVIASGELEPDADFGTSLTLYLYRVTINEHMRSQTRARGALDDAVPLSVDLHFLISVWADSAAAEHTICAWVMSQLHQHPIMDVSSLTEEGGWRQDDVVQIIPAELSNEDLMRIWDALAPNYRLSLSYIARVIRIDPDDAETGLPVVATRYQYEEKRDDDAD
ncbi:hypothetical protein Tel_12150 [Candidatus Tenderia electrophaga]|jgi:hypothetical protein|uniref:Pvc16 N-terminal domain-containing protein n=1 Tax=Candidatus Tenderia electrophaga TaxID=1748243 RepID=A0A0S2TF96_9GAMM|nr:hypothetical protein Tel_12150 [Candidatus Tenderia electrophaga]